MGRTGRMGGCSRRRLASRRRKRKTLRRKSETRRRRIEGRSSMQGHVSTCVVVTCMYTFGSRKYVQSRQPKTQDERGRCARHGSKTTGAQHYRSRLGELRE